VVIASTDQDPVWMNPAGLTRELGFELTDVTPDRVVVTVEVTSKLLQPYGIVHGGVYCALVETAASLGAAAWLGPDRQVVGVANTTHMLRAVRDGRLTATATPVHRGRSQQLWLVEIAEDSGRVVARGDLRLQNLDPAT